MKYRATISIFLLCIFVYVLELVFPQTINYLALSSKNILNAPWSLITYMFVHSLNSLSHIFYNMFALLLFGIILESVIGSKRFLMIYFASGIASGLVGLLFYSSIIGASGAIFGILGTLGILRPRLVVWVMGIPMPMLVALVIWALLDFIGIFGSDNVAHLGHLAGLGTGVVYGFLLRPKYGEKKKPKIKILSEDEIKKWENEWMKSG